jgi:hypothetical protein
MKNLIIAIADRFFAFIDLFDQPKYFTLLLLIALSMYFLKPYIVGVN